MTLEELKKDLEGKTENLIRLQEEMIKVREDLNYAIGEHAISQRLYYEENMRRKRNEFRRV